MIRVCLYDERIVKNSKLEEIEKAKNIFKNFKLKRRTKIWKK